MDNMIKTIIDIDKQARDRIAQANESRAKMIEELPEKKKAIESEIMDAVRAELKNFEAQKKAESEFKKTEIDIQAEESLKELEKKKSENFNKWVEKIVADTLS